VFQAQCARHGELQTETTFVDVCPDCGRKRRLTVEELAQDAEVLRGVTNALEVDVHTAGKLQRCVESDYLQVHVHIHRQQAFKVDALPLLRAVLGHALQVELCTGAAREQYRKIHAVSVLNIFYLVDGTPAHRSHVLDLYAAHMLCPSLLLARIVFDPLVKTLPCDTACDSPEPALGHLFPATLWVPHRKQLAPTLYGQGQAIGRRQISCG